MNPVKKEKAEEVFKKILIGLAKMRKNEINLPKIIISPPFIYFDLFTQIIKKKKIKFIRIFSQNVFWRENGSFTGEISPLMLKNLAVSGSIIGHSERRDIFGETDGIVNKKTQAVIKEGLTAVVCIGEKKSDRKKGIAFNVLENQLKNSLKGIGKDKLNQLIIAYEPVWAIGKKNACPPEEVIKSVHLIRTIIKKIYGGRSSEKIKVLYGGSLNKGNIDLYVKEKEIDGALIGRASLSANDFLEIIKRSAFK